MALRVHDRISPREALFPPADSKGLPPTRALAEGGPRTRRLTTLISESAEEWGLTIRSAGWVFWMPLVGALLVAAARVHSGIYFRLLKEDGPVEWSQFLFDALAAVFWIGIAGKRIKAGHRWQGLLFIGFGLAMIFIAGEEIAWGQRILGLQTPEALRAVNDQGEITVHNIVGVLAVFRFGMTMLAAFGSIAWLLNRRIRVGRYWDQADYLLVPPLFLAPAFFAMFAYRLTRYTLLPAPTYTIWKFSEYAELCLAFGICFFAFLNYRRLAAEERRRSPKRLDPEPSPPKRP